MSQKNIKLAIKLLKKIEWSSFTEGQGSGFMSSGPGPRVRVCPVCLGIDPRDPGKSDFNKGAHGHRKGCDLDRLIHIL